MKLIVIVNIFIIINKKNSYKIKIDIDIKLIYNIEIIT